MQGALSHPTHRRTDSTGRTRSTCVAKSPAKTTSEDGAKAAKKTAKTSSGASGEGYKKKRRKGRKETYSSYIYKGESHAYR